VLDALPRAIHCDFVSTHPGKPIEKLKPSFETACTQAVILHGGKVENGVKFHDIS
jgi:hypothetical protein